MKRARRYDATYSVPIESLTKDEIMRLNAQGVNMAEEVRKAIRETVILVRAALNGAKETSHS